MKTIRIGTRGSQLALRQAKLVQEAIRQADADIRAELVILRTKGDVILDRPLSQIGDKGLFVSEFERALLEDRIDLAVHSAKDLPMRLAQGLVIAAVLSRADVRDVLVIKQGGRLPGGDPAQPFVLGTGSKRRQIQAQKRWEGVSCQLIRGNVESRLQKLADGAYDGILLAKAGLDRLGINAQAERRFVFHALDPEAFLPAACQGIIAVEAKEASPLAGLLERISDAPAFLEFQVEREALLKMEADCSEPAAAWCRLRDGRLYLDVMYGSGRVSLCTEADLKSGLRLASLAAELVKPSASLAAEQGKPSGMQAAEPGKPSGMQTAESGKSSAMQTMARGESAAAMGKWDI